MIPSRDLSDDLGEALYSGNLEAVKSIFHTTTNPIEMFYNASWGPTRVRIYNLLFLSSILAPHNRPHHIEIIKWLTTEAKIPVDGPDLSGTSALSQTISTKPAFDPEIAQLLFDAGGDVNSRNRYGAVAAHEICMIWTPNAVPVNSPQALKWFLDHGGDLDISDGDGMSPRRMLKSLSSKTKIMDRVVTSVVSARQKKETGGMPFCGFCGDEGSKLLVCGRCKTAKYCAPPRRCQKGDWKRHKQQCTAPKS